MKVLFSLGPTPTIFTIAYILRTICCLLSCSAGKRTILLRMFHTIGLQGDGETQCCIKTFDTLNKQYDF